MNQPLRILHLEDESDYSDLVRSVLSTEGLAVDLELVQTRQAFEEALGRGFDLILADFSLPGYNGVDALSAARAQCPDTPFVLLSGTIGEQAAIASLKAGATDYLLKLSPERLAPAISRAVSEARERAERRRVETTLVHDRQRAEAELRESERQYRLMFDENPTPMWVFDQDTLAFLEVNDAALQHYGYSRDEFLRLTLRDLAPDELPALIEYLHQLLHANTAPRASFAGTWRHRKRDGTTLEVEIKWSRILFRGRPAGLALVTDITERRRIEQRNSVLCRLAQSLSSATCPAEAAGVIKNAADELFVWDAFTLDLYSAERDQVYSILNIDTDRSGRRAVVPPESLERAPSGMARRVIAHGAELILREGPISMPPDVHPIGDTSRPSASLALVPIRNRTKVIGILSLQSYTPQAFDCADLSLLQTLADHCGGALERLHAEQALHESEQRFRDLFRNSPDAIFVENAQGQVLDVNAAACHLHGMTREELLGKSVADLVPPDRREAVLRDFKALFDGHLRQVEGVSWTRDQREVPVEVRVNRIEFAGEPAVLLHVRDVTERKQAEAALRQLEVQLRQSQKMEAIGQLAGGVAHDFNNLLTIIHGHASLLAGAELPSAPGRSAQQIVQAAERAAGLTRQLLAFGRRQILQPRRLDANEVVANLTQMLGRILGEDIALQLHYSPQPAPIDADAGMMEQVLLNLAVNSRDAMPSGGVLTIRIGLADLDARRPTQSPEARPGAFVVLTVTDTGCGISSENLGRIFEPFFTTKEIGKGTGLGLATVYGIVHQHRGWLEVESQVSQGTSFKVFLPRSASLTSRTVERSLEQPVRGGSETILVVEDEAPVRELVCRLLAGYGYQILQAESGRHALDVWQRSQAKVDLLLTDLIMPDRLNGRQLAEKLSAEHPQLKVIYTSGYSEDVVGKNFELGRGLHYLQKPYPPRKLAEMVRQCLDASRNC